MSRAQAVVYGVVAGLAVGLLAGLAVVNIENLREAAAEDAGASRPVVHGETYEGDGEREARLVQSEAERLVYVRTVAPSAQFTEGVVPGPFRVRTGTGFTLVLPAREQAYSLAELAGLAPDTLVRQADAVYLLSENVAVLAGATLDIRSTDDAVGTGAAAATDDAVGTGGAAGTDDTAATDDTAHAPRAAGLELRLSSDESGFATIVGLGGTLSVTGSDRQPVRISSWNSRTGAVDVRTADGRAYLRAVGGSATLSHVEISDLGFWSGSTGGLALTGTDDGADPAAEPEAPPAEPAPVPGGAQLLQPRSAPAAAEQPATVTAALDSVRVAGNAFGIFVTRAEHVRIRHSEVTGSLVDGLVLHRSVTGSRITDTRSSDNAVDGIRVSRSSVGNVFSEVASEGNGRNGMFLDGQPLASGPSSAGTVSRSAGDNRILDSTFSDNARYGIVISGGDGVVVADSEIDAGESGIVVDKAASAVELTGNILREQSNQAIAVRDEVAEAVVTDNTITDVPTGIYVRNAEAELSANDLSRISNHAVTLVGRASGVAVTRNTVSGSGSTAVFTEDARGATVAGNDLMGWQPAPSLETVVRSVFQPLTIVWILVGLAILVTSLATASRRRGVIRHPYAERVPLASFTSGIVSRDSISHPR
jgi:hypothetical protein